MCKIAMQSSQVDLLEKRVKLSMYSLKSDAVGTTVKRGGGGGRGREGGGVWGHAPLKNCEKMMHLRGAFIYPQQKVLTLERVRSEHKGNME